MTVRIAQISDTHLSPSRPYFHSNFDLVAADLRTVRPDLVINTGDLALDGADSDQDLAEADAAHRALGLETRLLPGNHDVGDHPDVARRQPASAERLARYRRIVGDDFWSLDIAGWRIVGLNALILGTGLPGAEKQDELIAAAAATLNGRALALWLHKPLADTTCSETLSSNRFMTAGPRARLFELLRGRRPELVLCGHVHQYRDTTFDGSNHLWAPSTSFMISDPWQPGYGAKAVGYLMHEFEPDGVHRHRFAAVRGLVHHDLVSFPDAYGDVTRWGEGNA